MLDILLAKRAAFSFNHICGLGIVLADAPTLEAGRNRRLPFFSTHYTTRTLGSIGAIRHYVCRIETVTIFRCPTICQPPILEAIYPLTMSESIIQASVMSLMTFPIAIVWP